MTAADSIIPIALCLYILRCGFTAFFVASRHRVTVSHLYDFIRCIADGHHRNESEARLWSMWSSHHHITIHHINHDSREVRSNRLLLLLRFYNNRLYWLFALYTLVILTSHLWITVFFATTTTAASIRCDPTCNFTSLCHIEQHRRRRPLNTHIDYERISIDKDDDDPRYRFYRDSESGKYYVALRMIDGAYQWFHPPDLVRQFSSHNHTCICPVLMGIAENITFIESVGGGEWLVMYQPFVYRNSTLSYRIESSLIYRSESPFYENYRQFMFKTGLPQSLIHHETMYVEYTEIWPQSAVKKGSEEDKEEEEEEEDMPSLMLLLNQEEPVGRQRRITLTQSDTICFYFCDTMNGALIGG